VLDFWEAFDSVEPIGEQWRQTAETNTLIERLIEWHAAQTGQSFEPATVDSNMPHRYVPEVIPKIKPQRSDKSDFDAFGRSAGFNRGKHGNNDKPS
jgi:hypothetical protein